MGPPRHDRQHYDVCIVGAGPAGLAALSAIQEPYTLDTLSDYQVHQANLFLDKRRQRPSPSSSPGSSHSSSSSSYEPPNRRPPSGTKKRVCVVDPHPTWMAEWDSNFFALDIQYLRSPALAHPDHFDKNALLAYATAARRGDPRGDGERMTETLRSADHLIESGCADNRRLLPLGESQVGLWKLPSTSLFRDFCNSMVQRLAHEYIRGHVADISRVLDDDDDADDAIKSSKRQRRPFTLSVTRGGAGTGDEVVITATSVVLALGTAGRPIVPPTLREVREDAIFPWAQLRTRLTAAHSSVLVVGGGLTAVQAAQYALRQHKTVVLCSRRPLVERHFDIGEDWFDRRTAQRRLSSFYHETEDDRLRRLREARGGGSVPPIYLRDLDGWERKSRFRRIAAGPRFVHHSDDGRVGVSFDPADGSADGVEYFDCIILACGKEIDCTANPLVRTIQQKWPIKIVGGFPSVSEDLEWTPAKGLYVVGGLSSLNTGPDAANLMGMRRAAGVVANALDCRCWLRETESKVLANRYQAFWDDDESTVSSSSCDNVFTDDDESTDP
jgi:hypothetical protein